VEIEHHHDLHPPRARVRATEKARETPAPDDDDLLALAA
jgi:hypothetical protein